MNKIRVNITLDPKIKEQASKILEDLGLDLSTGISLFLKQVIVNEGLPFDISKSNKNIFYKYKQLKDFIEQYFNFKGSKYVPARKTLSKEDIKAANKELNDIKKGKRKIIKFDDFSDVLEELGIKIK